MSNVESMLHNFGTPISHHHCLELTCECEGIIPCLPRHVQKFVSIHLTTLPFVSTALSSPLGYASFPRAASTTDAEANAIIHGFIKMLVSEELVLGGHMLEIEFIVDLLIFELNYSATYGTTPIASPLNSKRITVARWRKMTPARDPPR